MKKFKTFFAAVLLCAGVAALTGSCSEKVGDPALPAAESVAGVYCGDMTCSVMGSESVFGDVTFTVEAVDDATADIVISPFGEPPMQVSSIAVSGVKVSGADGTYTLAATEFSGTTDDTGKVYSGTLRGSFENGILTILLNLQYGSMPMPLICTFSAPRQ